MFDIGFWELALIFVLALLVVGPERLPRLAAQLGNWAGQARRMARILTTQLREEIDADTKRAFEDLVSDRPAGQASYSRPGVEELRPKDPPERRQDSPGAPAAGPDGGTVS